jgi:hypothetical protein
MQPYHAYFTKKDVAIFLAGSMKVHLECPAVEDGDEIIFGEAVISKQNVLLYLTKMGKLLLVGLRTGECQSLAKFTVEEPIQPNFMIFQMGTYLVLWPDRQKNYFNMYDLKCSIMFLR